MMPDNTIISYLARAMPQARSAIPSRVDDRRRTPAPLERCGLCPACRKFICIKTLSPDESALCPCCGRRIGFVDPLGSGAVEERPRPLRLGTLFARVAGRFRGASRPAGTGRRDAAPSPGVWDPWLDS